MSDRGAQIALAVFSMVVLAFEVFLTRLLAYSVHVFFLYVILGVAMLGFGAAGSLVALRQGWLAPDRVHRALAWSAIAFVATMLGPVALFVRLTHFIVSPNPLTFVVAIILMLPFLAGGLVVTLALSSARQRIGGFYGANLIGSGLGCFLPLSLLGPLDGPEFLAALSLLGCGAALLYVRRVQGPRGALNGALIAMLGASLWTAGFSDAVYAIQPEPSPTGQADRIAQFSREHGIRMERRFDRWNPTGRIEVFEFDQVPHGLSPYPFLFYAHDSSAGSLLIRWDGRDVDADKPAEGHPSTTVARLCTQTVFAQAYFRPRPRSLIIGLGGGPDVQCALYHKAQQVDAVEINPDSIRAIRGPFDELLGGIGSDPRVRYHMRDGRGFAHGSAGKNLDLVQLSGVDTKSSVAAGAHALSENTLYTQEAFTDYLASLAPDGVVSIVRFGQWEAIRIANTMAAALRDMGAEHPERHITVIKNTWTYGVLVKRTPFTASEITALRELYQPGDPAFVGVGIFFYEIFGMPQRVQPTVMVTPDSHEPSDIGRFMEAMADETTAQFAAGYRYDISPTHDERPFFFDFFLYDRAESWQEVHVVTLKHLLGALLVLSMLLILLPVWRLRERGSLFSTWVKLKYFGCIGLAYLLLEVWMLHRFAMYLGHQTYSLAVVLSSLLIATGLGAALGPRLIGRGPTRIRLAVAGVVLWAVAGHYGFGALQDATWQASLVTRAAITIALVAPAGFMMGWPFPAALGWVQDTTPTAVPWCIGVNAFCSVLATVLVIPLSMSLGYTAVWISAAALYGFAATLSLAMKPG